MDVPPRGKNDDGCIYNSHTPMLKPQSPTFIYSWYINHILRTKFYFWAVWAVARENFFNFAQVSCFWWNFFFHGQNILKFECKERNSYKKQLYIKLGSKPMSMIVKRGGTRTNLKLDWTTQKEGVTKICMHCCCAILLALMQSDLIHLRFEVFIKLHLVSYFFSNSIFLSFV